MGHKPHKKQNDARNETPKEAEERVARKESIKTIGTKPVEGFENFLISGTGRCGTRFLANLMNRSEKWTVLHEPGPAGVAEYTTYDQCVTHNARFNRHYYGEVNSMLRRIFLHLTVAKRGLLIRNPYEVYISIANRRRNTDRKWVDEFQESLGLISYALSNKKFKIKRIDFKKLITNVDYTQSILNHFGVDDVEVTEEDITTKVNFTEEENRKYKTIKDLPPEIRKEILISSERFLESIGK